ncbi:putative RNA-directed DNA polymerase [Helianthus debilis subsp. tardiflorus]
MERVADSGGDDYPNQDNIQDIRIGTDDSEVTPGTAPVRGIGLRVTNIEGNPLMPRRGIYSTNNPSILDGLAAISKPVGLDYGGDSSNVFHANHSTTNPSSEGDILNVMDNLGNKEKSDVFNTTFAEKLKGGIKPNKVNFRFLKNEVKQGNADVTIPLESVKKVQEKCSNVLYGYFLDKRLAFPVVEYFVKNRWNKYGFQKSMMNAKGFFFFKFDSREGMEQVLHDGPWLIRNVPIFLKPWSSETEIKKEEFKKIPVWVKMHDVPLAAYTEDGLSLIASRIGSPKFLDNETSNMCLESWGRSSYARAVIELDAEKNLEETVSVAIPNVEGGGFLLSVVKVEYEWSPPRCSTCCVFGHTKENCPKEVKTNTQDNRKGKEQIDGDGYMDVNKKKAARKGIAIKEKPKFEYRPIQKYSNLVIKEPNSRPGTSKAAELNSRPGSSTVASAQGNTHTRFSPRDDAVQESSIKLGNSFGCLDSDEARLEDETSDDEEVIEINETSDFMQAGNEKPGASTPADKGTRILLGWNRDYVDLMVLSITPQVMHAQLVFKDINKAMFCSFVYADNYYMERRKLWESLCIHKHFVRTKPWVIMGDFNSSLYLEDMAMGSSKITTGMRDFKECVQNLEVFDVNSSGFHYTWSQKPKKGMGILKKIDRVMANVNFTDEFPSSCAVFHPYRISDHTPCLLKLPGTRSSKPKPFKFPNFLAYKKEFGEMVKSEWMKQIEGVPMFRVVKKLRALKHPIRSLLYKQGNLHNKVKSLHEALDEIQAKVDQNPADEEGRQKESELLASYQEALMDEERFLSQKAKVEWLKVGDSNSAYFHNSVKCRNHRSRVDIIKDTDGNLYEGAEVPTAFVNHFTNFLGQKGNTTRMPTPDLFPNMLDPSVAEHMAREVTVAEIKSAMFSIGDNKAPGPDGYSSAFFKKGWPIVGEDVCTAIKDFFTSNRLLQEVNHTFIALIPKIPTPSMVTDYRPISCCNVLYKCITKILSNRILEGLDKLVTLNQSAFVPNRRITDNILLVQKLMHNYHRESGAPRCAFKVDIQKAYDTVDWDFLGDILKGYGFHPSMVEWIMKCISSSSFSVSVNGNIFGYFKGRRGLRQGDPMSPYLFTLVMEVLTSKLQRATSIDSAFRFHKKCENQRIVNLCFADDLFLFSRGDVTSVKVIMDALNRFKDMSGLIPSLTKSTVFFCNVPNHVKSNIRSIMPFEEGSLPIRYLGVPLIASRLLYSDCKVLVEKMENRITDWKAKYLSFAGRLQLIISVLSSFYIYWASVFVLPASIVKQLEQKMRSFLWCQGHIVKGKAKVSWNVVCLPKSEGGLGVRRIADVNKALMAFHMNSILSRRKSLWVEWVYSYHLQDRSLWDIPNPNNACWSWRKLLQLRPIVRKFFVSKIGDGRSTFLWYDNWSDHCPLSSYVTPRQMRQEGLSIYTKVADVVQDNTWRWPTAWRDMFPILFQLAPISIEAHKSDCIMWKYNNDSMEPFATKVAWNSLRRTGQQVNWYNMVWSSFNIPRHAFLCWLIYKRKLATQDRIQMWNNAMGKVSMMCCLLCNKGLETHEHLFFECTYSKQIWFSIRKKIDMMHIDGKWDEIMAWIIPNAKSKRMIWVIRKLVVAAIAYFVWQERNTRFFNNQLRPPEVLEDVIVETVRLKLHSFKYKVNEQVSRLLKTWKISLLNESDHT